MAETCFYCSEEIEANQLHYASFVISNQESEKTLCDHCYQEWLHGTRD